VFGAADLDVSPVTNGPIAVGHITVARDSPITLTFRPDRTGWTPISSVRIVLTGRAGAKAIDHSLSNDDAVVHGRADAEGKYEIALTGRQLPDNGSAFELEVTYTAPQTL
jgi:hypothetical protein